MGNELLEHGRTIQKDLRIVSVDGVWSIGLQDWQ